MNIKELAKEAQKKCICVPGMKRILASNDKEALLNYYIEGLDFCLEHDFPSKEYLKEEGGPLLPKFGIHIDEECTLINRERIIMLGNCKASVASNSYSVTDIYIKHDSKAKVFVSDHAFVRIDAFDNASLQIVTEGNAKVLVNIYGNATVTHTSNDNSHIKTINKRKESY